MSGKALAEAIDDLNQIKGFVRGFQSLREYPELAVGAEGTTLFTGVTPSHLKLLEYCASVIRTYSVFERVIQSLAEAWVNWALKVDSALVLANPGSRTSYEIGLAEIFRRQTEPRFSGVDRFALAKCHGFFDSKLEKKNQAELLMAPFFATLPNLQTTHICTLFTNIASGSPATWLDNSPRLLSLRDDYSLGHVEALKDLVQRRNEVAHGNPNPSEILGTNVLLAQIEIIAAIASSLHQFLLSTAAMTILQGKDKDAKVGDVTHHWPKAQAFELKMSSTVLSVGEKVMVMGVSECFAATITSIQIEGHKTTGFTGKSGTLLGIQMDKDLKQGATLLRASRISEIEMILN